MFTIRPFETGDAGAIRFVYKQAFAGAPWFEKLTDDKYLNVGKKVSSTSVSPRWSRLIARLLSAAIGAKQRTLPKSPGNGAMSLDDSRLIFWSVSRLARRI
ncbi:hypothetical protein A2482_02745 [Candidatus Falkowbacteria bacterium RIFOXYC2_FULL_48_21]|uniref:Uncharacterized protein n=1 Tax=Candidatus Falkowbacteria bacterium RIFOXYC2_FULL_48_21 TaxID=1798005 RepID=A0A1F5T5L3_9BACT|nr:MAG: hypothetical protein A2482_02745 [Candidatus Falkowbacteria bacterium RIFOXYC2_FULL_48_21]